LSLVFSWGFVNLKTANIMFQITQIGLLFV